VRTAVVTGATGGIGSAVVQALTNRGDRVLAVARIAPLADSTPELRQVRAGFGRPHDPAACLRAAAR